MVIKAKWKDCLRSVWKSRNRFLSILCIVAIGVGFFAGVKASGPDMRRSTDIYADRQNLMNFRLLSTWGFDEEDVELLKDIPGAKVRPSWFLDSMIEGEWGESVARIYAFQPQEEINELWLSEGRWPRVVGECLVFESSQIPIGATVRMTGGTDTDIADSLENTEYTVVGKVYSSMYVSEMEFGNTNVGGGRINQILYVPYRNFKSEYYTEVYVTFDDMLETQAYSDAYAQLETTHEEDLKVIAADLASQRYERTVQAAEDEIRAGQEQIDEGWAELQDARKQLNEAKQQAADGQAEITNGEQQIADGEEEIADGEAEIAQNERMLQQKEEELADARDQINAADQAYQQGLADYNAAKSEAEAQLAQAEEQLSQAKQQLDDAEAALTAAEAGYQQAQQIYTRLVEAAEAELERQQESLDSVQAEYDAAYEEYEALLKEMGPDAEEVIAKKAEVDRLGVELETRKILVEEAQKAYDTQKANADALLEQAGQQLAEYRQSYEEGLQQYQEGLAEYEKQKEQALAQLAEAEAQLKDAKAQIDSGKAQIDSGEKQISSAYGQIRDAKSQLEAGKQKIEDSKAQLAEAKEQLFSGQKTIEENEEKLQEAEDQLREAEEKLSSSRKELAELTVPDWYVYTRDDNAGYEEYGQNAERVNNIAKVFPVFFILVAALVCMTTMTRMIEEDRTQIGTMKALGYGNGTILFKYMSYALSATCIGSILGLAVGYQLFPRVIMTAYGIMYGVPVQKAPFLWGEAAVITLICMAVVALVVYLSCRYVLSPMPAQLMRPKAPQKGKRVLLERVGVIWKHLSFSHKVTVRNIFRYKKRMFMTIIGIMGCTALSLTGFGLRDAISDIVENQFHKIWQYQAMVVVDGITDSEAEETLKILQGYDPEAEELMVSQKMYTMSGDNRKMSAYLMVPQSGELLADFIHLAGRTNGQVYTLQEEGVLLTEKLAKQMGLKAGDTVTIEVDEMHSVQTTVQGIVENYAQHYAYMLPATYEKLFGDAPEYNMILVRYSGLDEAAETTMSEQIVAVNHVMTMQLQKHMMETFSQMLKAMDTVVLVLILSAGMLAYVVLYNLANVNINERIREIATLEVLGFNDKEVSQYVFRESIVLTLIGAVLGLALGRLLTAFVVQTAEIDIVMFGREVKFWSYIWAFALTILFSWIVNRFMHKPLRQISMVESLKSVE